MTPYYLVRGFFIIFVLVELRLQIKTFFKFAYLISPQPLIIGVFYFMDKYRIAEYADHFRIQKLFTEVKRSMFLYFTIRKEEKQVWKTILKDGSVINIRNCFELDSFQFKSYKEAKENLDDLLKYPIYHYLN